MGLLKSKILAITSTNSLENYHLKIWKKRIQELRAILSKVKADHASNAAQFSESPAPYIHQLGLEQLNAV
jgi:hypothetical protein